MKLTHATHQGSHLYKFNMGEPSISELLADGVPVDTSWLPSSCKYETPHFFKFDHEVQVWSKMCQTYGGRFVRNQVDNPFKFDLPSLFPNKPVMNEFAIDKGLLPEEEDDDEDPPANPLANFYTWESETGQEEKEVIFDEVRELGEIIPCPEVDFPWTVVQPHESGIPCELWHLVRVQVSRKDVEQLFWDWVSANKEALCISSMYPSQEGAIHFSARGASTSIRILKDREFCKLLSAVEGENLESLRSNWGERFAVLKQMMRDRAPLSDCPRCDGGGKIPCPRCSGAGVTDKGLRAEAAGREVLTCIHSIKGSRGQGAVRDAEKALERLMKFCLVD